MFTDIESSSIDCKLQSITASLNSAHPPSLDMIMGLYTIISQCVCVCVRVCVTVRVCHCVVHKSVALPGITGGH